MSSVSDLDSDDLPKSDRRSSKADVGDVPVGKLLASRGSIRTLRFGEPQAAVQQCATSGSACSVAFLELHSNHLGFLDQYASPVRHRVQGMRRVAGNVVSQPAMSIEVAVQRPKSFRGFGVEFFVVPSVGPPDPNSNTHDRLAPTSMRLVRNACVFEITVRPGN